MHILLQILEGRAEDRTLLSATTINISPRAISAVN